MRVVFFGGFGVLDYFFGFEEVAYVVVAAGCKVLSVWRPGETTDLLRVGIDAEKEGHGAWPVPHVFLILRWPFYGVIIQVTGFISDE